MAKRKVNKTEQVSDMDARIVQVLIKTHNYIQADAEAMAVGDQDLVAMVPDYIDLHGDDKDACKVFWDLSDEAQKSLLKKAFPYYKKGS